jgi:outer membrane protein assembly factor BamB
VGDPAVANGLVFFSSTIGSVVRAVNASNGNVLWTSLDTVAPLDPVISNGRVYVGSKTNNLWVFGL